MDLFEIKYFMILVIIFQIMMSCFLLVGVYKGYKKNRTTITGVILTSILMLVILLVTLAITVFVF